MKEYIDRDALLKDICGNDPSHMEDYYFNAIANAPTADVVAVVRCKDCEWWRHTYHDPITNYDYGVCLCDQWEYKGEFAGTTSNDFCSYGERKEQE